jgi:nucleoside-diphosphate-sugar epimerase
MCQFVAGVPRLVYLSSYNVVYGGQRTEGGDEALPYFPPDRHPDAYSRTKALAEQAVLAADGAALSPAPGSNETEGFLRTCALRPAAIYGPGEQRHLPRM